MRTGKKAAFVFAAAVMLLTACGASNTAVTTEEIVVPEMSSKDILVNSLEYLLEEENGEEKETQTGQPEEGAEGQEREAGTETKEAVICYGKDMESGLTQETVTADKITPDVLLGALARHNIVPLLDTKALSLEEREEDGKRVLYLDLSRAFREYLMTMSMEAECIIVSSIANTFLENYEADAVYIKVEGETLVSSHVEYTEAVARCTPAELMAQWTASDTAKQEE